MIQRPKTTGLFSGSFAGLFCTIALILTATVSANATSFATSRQTSKAGDAVDLLEYMKAHVQSFDDSSGTYNRLQDFGGWVHQDGCHDTREMVLARSEDPSVPVKLSANGCTIKGGLWHEPYTGTDVTDPANLQIDHVVPLREAYYSGASEWSGPIRCNYANYIGNDFHLLAVSGHENMSKGDHGPSGYLPPNKAEQCEYVKIWMEIKTIWQLTTTAEDVQAIESVFASEHCDDSFRQMTASDLADQRSKAATPIAQCENFGN